MPIGILLWVLSSYHVHPIQAALMDRQEGPMVQLKGAKFGYEETIG